MRAVLSRVVLAVAPVGGVVAVALGGSAARGREVEGSDLDVGLSYRGSAGLDVDGLRAAVATLDPRPEVEVTRLGEWGEWVDGGAWLAVDGRRVDLLYRDLDRVEHHLAEGVALGVVDAAWATEAEAVLAAPGGAPEALASSLARARRLLDALS